MENPGCSRHLQDEEIIDLLQNISPDEDTDYSEDHELYIPLLPNEQESTSEAHSSESEDDNDATAEFLHEVLQEAPRKKRPRLDNHSNVGWSEYDCTPTVPVFHGDTGVVDGIGLDESCEVIDFFLHFVDVGMMRTMKEQTNLYARQNIRRRRSENRLSPNSRLHKWKAVTLNDIKKCLGIILHMSISDRPSLSDHWCSDPVLSCNFFPNVLSRDRFLLILSNLQLADNSKLKRKGEPGFDSLYKVRPLITPLVQKFKSTNNVGENITIDEGMCPFRGRVNFRVYMPDKPNKYGMKIFMLSKATSGYVWNFEVYQGEGIDNSVPALVKRLLDSLVNRGHTLFTDRYYTSPDLALELEKLNTGLVGTVNKTRRGIPRVLYEPKSLKRNEQVFRRKGNVLLSRWKDKRDVWMVSPRHRAGMSTYTDKRGRDKTKPLCVIDYNKNKYGVDLSDQRMSYASFSHRSFKWWRKLALHLILMGTCNACVLYSKIKKQSIAVTSFIQQVCTELVLIEDHPTKRNTSQLARLSEKHFIEKIPIPEGKKSARRRCVVCSEKGSRKDGTARRKDTSWYCKDCDKGFCPGECFKLYHSKKVYDK